LSTNSTWYIWVLKVPSQPILVGLLTTPAIPIPMVRELAITASLGVAYKVITNLLMLPLMASSRDAEAWGVRDSLTYFVN
jgi:hypothetical protein